MSSSDKFADAIDAVIRRIADQAGTEIRTIVNQFDQNAAAEREAAVRDALRASETKTQAVVAAELERVHAEHESSRSQAEAAFHTELSRARVDEREAVLAGMERLLSGLRRLDQAAALTEVFDALTDAVADETARVAMLLVQGGGLKGWRFLGFGPSAGLGRGVDVTEPEHSAVARALASGDTCLAQSDIGGGSVGFGPVPLPPGRVGLAVPLRVGGRVVAVLYADDVGEGERPVPAAWPEVVEVFARHASRCLEALTAVRTAQLAERRPAAPMR
jgi:hypothetical protein